MNFVFLLYIYFMQITIYLILYGFASSIIQLVLKKYL